mmetsp:Transcript_39679/g.89961  ORF Transcript_39679/g.89961 Transcript_39679/m.89961 type:complete len:121 (+) Transcript_39679:242-604(+)
MTSREAALRLAKYRANPFPIEKKARVAKGDGPRAKAKKQKLEAVLEEREYELEALPAWVCPRPLPSCGHTTSSHRRRFSSPVKRLRRLCAYARGQTPRSQKGGEARHLVPHMPPARLPPA